MDTITSEVTTRDLRSHLSDVLGRAMYAGERIGITRHGKLAAVVLSVDDLEALEELEMARDVAAYDKAKAEDEGVRIVGRRPSSARVQETGRTSGVARPKRSVQGDLRD